jgi:hypothetical protein
MRNIAVCYEPYHCAGATAVRGRVNGTDSSAKAGSARWSFTDSYPNLAARETVLKPAPIGIASSFGQPTPSPKSINHSMPRGKTIGKRLPFVGLGQ